MGEAEADVDLDVHTAGVNPNHGRALDGCQHAQPGAIALPRTRWPIPAQTCGRRGNRALGVAETDTHTVRECRSFCAQRLFLPTRRRDIISGMLDALFGGNSGNKKQQQDELQALVN